MYPFPKRKEKTKMNDAAFASSNMYDEVTEINQLNRVDGFDPRRYMRLIENEGQPAKYYLDVAYRKLWFRLKYPQGKIVKKILKLTEQVAIIEARVYLDHNDAEENFISNALAQRCQSNDDQFGNKYVELAETAAVGRALSDAGFGLQFADQEKDFDPDVTEAPIEERIMRGGSIMGGNPSDRTVPVQQSIEEPIPTPIEVNEAVNQGITPAQGIVPIQKPENEIRKDMPVEEIYQRLNRDAAAAVVVPMGFNKGKTLGQVAIEKPNSLEWYVTSYGGPDNLLRAAAKFLMDTALSKAS